MDMSVIKEYLVKLGWQSDDAQFHKVEGTLKGMGKEMERFTSEARKRFLEMGAIISGVYAALGTATVGLLDKISQGETEYRLFALKMYMSVDAAKKLKIATD